MTPQDDFLERIRLTELENLDKLTKFLAVWTIESTKDYIGSQKVKQSISEKKFKPDPYFKWVMLTFGLLLLTIPIKETFFKSNTTVTGLVFGYSFAAIFIYIAIKQFYFDKSLNYVITIDATGISIDDMKYFWKDIYDTAILTDSTGGDTTKYLIIAMNNLTTYEKFELTKFINLKILGFSGTLSKYIEYFKPAR
jgi:hypothetical protein